MKTIALILATVLFCTPAFAQEGLAPGLQGEERPAFDAQIRNLVKVLFPEAGYADQKALLLSQFDTMLDEKFGCIRQDSDLQKKIHVRLGELYSYDAMVDQIVPIFSELSEQDVVRILNFYQSGTGQRWASISARLPQEADEAGRRLGERFGQEVLPILAEDKTCAAKLKDMVESAKEKKQ